MYIWTKALQTSLEQRRMDLIEKVLPFTFWILTSLIISKVLADFGAKLAAEISEETIADCLHVVSVLNYYIATPKETENNKWEKECKITT